MEETSTLDFDSNGSFKKKAYTFKLYKKRWFVLFLFWTYTSVSFMHFLEYAVIADVIVKYYSVSYSLVNTASTVFFLLYIPFCLPGNFILDKLGLRMSVLIGATFISIGAWIKVFSVEPNRFWVLILGQCIISVCQVLVLPLPPKVAAVWFGPKEVSLACTIGVTAAQAASGIGAVIPPLIVQPGDIKIIHQGLKLLSYAFAIPSTLIIPVLYFFFDDAPPSPPSKAQFHIEEMQKLKVNYTKSLKNLITNKSFLLLLIVFGINISVAGAEVILLNQFVLYYHPDATVDVGIIELLLQISGMLGSLSIGFLITKTGKMKELAWFSIISTSLSMTAFVFLLDQSLWVVYITTLIYNFLTANLYLVFLVFSADCLLFCIKFDFKRQAVNKRTLENEESLTILNLRNFDK